MNQPNKEGQPSAEVGEGRAQTGESIVPSTMPLTQSGKRMSQGWNGVRQAAKDRKQERFTALLHHVTVGLLRDSFFALKRQAAPGVDGVTWQEYETGLEDRLVDLHSRVQVNRYLEEEYCDEHNRRFAIEPHSEVDYHLPAPGARKRREIFRLETERTLANDGVVRHHNRFYQVERKSRRHAPAKSMVLVCEWADGTVEIHYRSQKLRWHEIQKRPGKPQEIGQQRRKHRRPPAPLPDHPWRKTYQDLKAWRPTGAVSGSSSVASPSAPP